MHAQAEAPSTRPLVVITGAAGRVGTITTRALASRYTLRLVDLDWPPDGDSWEGEIATERKSLDLSHRAAWDEALKSAHAVVHLAGNAHPEIDARTALEDGAMLTAHLADAAADSGVKRIVFASSIHTLGLHHRHGPFPIRQQLPASPCCEYGAAKLFSESLLRIMTERTTVSAVCLRLGLTGYSPETAGFASQWLGPGDYAQLLHASLTVPIRYGTYLGMSAGAAEKWDLTDTIKDLGFVPTDATPDPVPSTNREEPGPPHCLMFEPAILPTPPDQAED